MTVHKVDVNVSTASQLTISIERQYAQRLIFWSEGHNIYSLKNENSNVVCSVLNTHSDMQTGLYLQRMEVDLQSYVGLIL